MTQLELALKDVKDARIFQKEIPIMGRFLEDNHINIVSTQLFDHKAHISLLQGQTPYGMKVWWGQGFSKYISLCKTQPRAEGWSECNCCAIIWKDGNLRHDMIGALLGNYIGFHRGD